MERLESNIEDMIVKEFIEAIANGTLTAIDIEDYCKDLNDFQITSLLEELDIEILSYLCGDEVVLVDDTDSEGNTLIEVSGGNSITIEAARLRAAYNLIFEHFANSEPQQIPKELATQEAKVYFDKAIRLGLMDCNYKWLKGMQMLACFAYEMSKKLKLGKGENADGRSRISWKPFETLFSVDRGKLRLNYNDIQKTGQQPKDSYLIDGVFK